MAEDSRESRDECTQNAENETYDPRLDFFSDQFDPLLALQTPGLKIPDPKAKKYDNLALYKSAEVKEKFQQQNELNKKPAEEAQPQNVRRWLPHQLPIQTTVKVKSKNLLKRMEKIEGPLALLRKCKEERLRIKIWTRNDRGIRGYCLAYIVAFDKHWNMALEDVTECWSRLKKLKVPALDSAETTRSRKRVRPPSVHVRPHQENKKLESCQRYVKQLLVRGEHVVFIQIVKEETTEDVRPIAASNETDLSVVKVEIKVEEDLL